jgi:hypothetical protein
VKHVHDASKVLITLEEQSEPNFIGTRTDGEWKWSSPNNKLEVDDDEYWAWACELDPEQFISCIRDEHELTYMMVEIIW